MTCYSDFLRSKRIDAPSTGIADPPALSTKLFPFQRDITRWALRRGRAAIWADCGLGKGWMALEWARVVTEHTGRPVLILAPLAVSQQFAREGAKLGVNVTVCREGSDVREGINVVNYERIHKIDAGRFAGVVADESSILKDHTASTRNAIIEAFAHTRFKLSCTATPAPNDHIELGNHAEFLGVMSRVEMLSMFFVHDGGSTQDWRLKGHARKEFWRWISSWAVNIRFPSDLGYDDCDFRLPPLRMHEHVVQTDDAMARNAGMLFAYEANGLQEQRAARRGSLDERVKIAAEMVNASSEPWIVWCDLNAESEALTKAIPDAVQVTGSDSSDWKEMAAEWFIGNVCICGAKKGLPDTWQTPTNMTQCSRAKNAKTPTRGPRCKENSTLTTATSQDVSEGCCVQTATWDSASLETTQQNSNEPPCTCGHKSGRRVLVSKASIFGHGLNFQHCHNTAFVGISHSFEAWYQAIRRTYRFGQTQPVDCHVITSSAEGPVVANLKRKQADAESMATGMLEHMRDIQKANIKASTRTFDDYKPKVSMRIPSWVGQEDV